MKALVQYIKNSIILAFFSRFIAALVMFQLIVLLIHTFSPLAQKIQHVLASIVSWFYQHLDSVVFVDGNMLIHPNNARYLIVDNECTGLLLVATVWAAIVAFEHKWLSKLKMMMIAFFVLQFINVIRIVHLLFEIKEVNNNFEFYHLYFWQSINFGLAILVLFILDKLFKFKDLK